MNYEEFFDETYEQYNNFLDECYGNINICGLNYQASEVFKKIDPVAYKCGYNDFMDNL